VSYPQPYNIRTASNEVRDRWWLDAGADAGRSLTRTQLIGLHYWNDGNSEGWEDATTAELREAWVELLRGEGYLTNPRRNPYANEHAARLHDPRYFHTFRRKNVKNGTVGLILGKPWGQRTMVLQSVRFRAAAFTPAQARAWLTKHKLKAVLEPATTRDRASLFRAEVARARRTARKTTKRRARRRA
jgi:hypothetical protein